MRSVWPARASTGTHTNSATTTPVRFNHTPLAYLIK
jgi:hypothetical protein